MSGVGAAASEGRLGEELGGGPRRGRPRGRVLVWLPRRTRLALVACSLAAACLAGSAEAQQAQPEGSQPAPRTQEGPEETAQPPGAAVPVSPEAADLRDAERGAVADAAAGEAASSRRPSRQYEKALADWHVAYRDFKMALKELCTGGGDCAEQGSCRHPVREAAGDAPPSALRRAADATEATEGAAGAGGSEGLHGSGSRETHSVGTSPVRVPWREMSLRGKVVRVIAVALNPLVRTPGNMSPHFSQLAPRRFPRARPSRAGASPARCVATTATDGTDERNWNKRDVTQNSVQVRAIAGQLLLANKTYVWARDRLPDHMRHGLVDLEGMSAPTPRRVACLCQ